jgi:3-methyladenine DNA glycosylase AlkD
MDDMGSHLASFRKTLRENSDPERARNEKRYLKSPFKFFGVPVPFITKMAREFKKANREATSEYVFEIAGKLWASEYHQEKTLAIKMLELYSEHLDIKAMPMLESMLNKCTGWDHTDGIAVHLVGEVLGKDKRAYAHLKRWSRSENFWMRRASLVSQILPLRKGAGDKKLFFKLSEKMIEEKEFFIRKAIGWTLREISKAEPEAAFDFLMSVRDRASGLTLREGAKRLPEEARQRVAGG